MTGSELLTDPLLHSASVRFHPVDAELRAEDLCQVFSAKPWLFNFIFNLWSSKHLTLQI